MSRIPGLTVALSISDAPDRARLGFPAREIERALFTLCTALIRSGARIQYAGDLRPTGWTFRLFRHLTGAYAGQQDAPFIHVVAEPVLRRTSFEGLVDAATEAQRTAESCFVIGGRLRPAMPHRGGLLVDPHGDREHLSDAASFAAWLSRFPEVVPAAAFTQARRLATAAADGRVAMGGKMGVIGVKGDAYEGAMPGIAEEAVLALEAGLPFVALGAFGGATRDVAIALDLLPGAARVPRGPQADTYGPGLARVEALRPAIPDDVRERLRGVATSDRAEWIAREAVEIIASWPALSRP